jgi:16S rRNA (cytosine1402-N4)-methyltransferase
MNNNRVGYLKHDGVMISEVNSIVSNTPAGIFVDATYGYGSHFNYLKQNNNHLEFIGIDRDIEAVHNSSDQISHINFSKITDLLSSKNILNISGVFYDFGVSSHQIDNSDRGFSYLNSGPLDMRMNQDDKITADEVLNQFEEEDIANILYKYSGEKNSRKIAKAIYNSRPLKSTEELSKVLKNVLGKQNPKYINQTIKRCFQAIRIYINNELEEITLSISKIKNFIKPGGVIVCLTYHSLEDKIVKDIFNDLTVRCVCNPRIPICNCDNIQEFRFGNNKKLYPSDDEINNNSRSTSATLRYVVKI